MISNKIYWFRHSILYHVIQKRDDVLTQTVYLRIIFIHFYLTPPIRHITKYIKISTYFTSFGRQYDAKKNCRKGKKFCLTLPLNAALLYKKMFA